ncbi:MAG: hypothetical protein ABIY51_13920 [Ferruginibacter sp.]
MKYLFIVIAVFCFISCNNNSTSRPTTALDTGREFIRASLDGNFKGAETLIFKDTQNVQLFDSYKQFYSKLPGQKKSAYQKASYEINKYQDLNDSTTIINYSNSYMKKPMDIKVVRKNDLWQIDFKFTYSENPIVE